MNVDQLFYKRIVSQLALRSAWTRTKDAQSGRFIYENRYVAYILLSLEFIHTGNSNIFIFVRRDHASGSFPQILWTPNRRRCESFALHCSQSRV